MIRPTRKISHLFHQNQQILLTRYLSGTTISPTTTKEIEKKFLVTENIVKYCERNATKKKEISLIDTYFDNSSYALTRHDMWLRERNNAWELKVPSHEVSNLKNLNGIDYYLEFQAHQEIINYIHQRVRSSSLSSQLSSLSYQSLETLGVFPFIRLTSLRTRYYLQTEIVNRNKSLGLQSFFVDIDNVQYDPVYLPEEARDRSNLTYSIGEIELSPPMLAATSPSYLMDFIFRQVGINPSPVRGKLLEYIHRHRPEHYQALQSSGQLRSKGIKN